MTDLLDERIDRHQSMDKTYRNKVVRTLFRSAQYQGIANTIVQLISWRRPALIALSQSVGQLGPRKRSRFVLPTEAIGDAHLFAMRSIRVCLPG